jgi:TonB-linked SusC/RagA family outer membrane protein
MANTFYRPFYQEAGMHQIQKDSLIVKSNNSSKKVELLYEGRDISKITGAVSSIQGNKVARIGGTNRLNSISGLVPGLVILQNEGLPGNETSRVYIRGQNGFGVSGTQALVLVDGYETEISNVNPYDIESITVLKDAVSTAMYGMRANNGIILITTKRGREGNIQVNLHSSASYIKPTKQISFLGAADYARLYNEALVNEGKPARYNEEDILAFENQSNPYRLPDNRYINDFVGNNSWQIQNTLDVSGGSERAKFLILISYLNNSGLFSTDEDVNAYSTNTSHQLTDVHSNLNFRVGEKLSINFDMKAKIGKERYPGAYINTYMEDFYALLYNTPPMAYPIFNPDGSLGGTTDYRQNIYGLLNNSGYSLKNHTYMLGDLDFTYDLDDIFKGLSVIGRFAYRNFNDHIIDRSKLFAVYELIDLPDSLGGVTYNKIGENTSMQSVNNWGPNNNYYNGEFGFAFARNLGQSQLSSRLFLDRQYFRPSTTLLPNIYQGLKFSLFYNYNTRYLLDFVLSVNGNNQFPENNRYGIFPAVGLGWIVTNENFFQNSQIINFLKLRFSAGKTGNSFNPYSDATPYFAYMENYELTSNGYPYGTNAGTYYQGFEQTQIPNPAITWEECFKFNAGFDMKLLSNRLFITADYFIENNNNILVQNANSGILGANFWYPAGKVENKGFETQIGWQKLSGDFRYYITANVTFVENKILEQREEDRAYEWMVRTGNPVGSQFGYVFDRYFTEEDDFSTLPDQSLLGKVMPGDLKYQDLNGDNIINENDQKIIGKSSVPETYFGLNMGLEYKGFGLDILFQGMTNVEQYFNGAMIFEFSGGRGNVTSTHLNRWNPGDGQDAGYPRLGIQDVSNNRVKSDYWIKDISLIRLKSAQLTYSFDENFVKNVEWVRKFEIYLSGYNLFTWSGVDLFDPETSANGQHYPITSYYTLGFNIGF